MSHKCEERTGTAVLVARSVESGAVRSETGDLDVIIEDEQVFDNSAHWDNLYIQEKSIIFGILIILPR